MTMATIEEIMAIAEQAVTGIVVPHNFRPKAAREPLGIPEGPAALLEQILACQSAALDAEDEAVRIARLREAQALALRLRDVL
jgi:hypothetical protein